MQFASGATINHTDGGIGPPVLFLHALGRSAADWSIVIEQLTSSFRCIAIDLPGHGNSEWTGRYQFKDLARATADLIAELDLDRFSIVAHSMGGMVAWILAPEVAGRLDALIVEDTPAPTNRHAYPDVPLEPPGPVDYDWEVRRQIFSELNSPNPAWRERLQGLSVRTLLVAGTANDQEMGETSDLLSDARIVTIPVGHWIHQDASAEYVRVIRPFLLGDM